MTLNPLGSSQSNPYTSLSSPVQHETTQHQNIHQSISSAKGYGEGDSLVCLQQKKEESNSVIWTIGKNIATFFLIGIVGSLLTLSLGALSRSAGLFIQGAGAVRTGAFAKALTVLGQGLAACGNAVFLVSKKVFVVFSIPPYLLFVEFPKWLYLDGIPVAMRFIRKLLTGFSDKFLSSLNTIGGTIRKGVEYLAQKVLAPVVPILEKGLKFLKIGVSKVVETALKGVVYLKDAVVTLGHKVVELLVKATRPILPVLDAMVNAVIRFGGALGQGLAKVWNVVKGPILTFTDGVVWVFSSIKTVAVTVWDRALQPFFSFAGSILTSVGSHVKQSIQAFFGAIKSSVVWVYESVKPIFKLVKGTAEFVISVFSKGFTTIGTKVGEGLKWSWKHISQAGKVVGGSIKHAALKVWDFSQPAVDVVVKGWEVVKSGMTFVWDHLSHGVMVGVNAIGTGSKIVYNAAAKGLAYVGKQLAPAAHVVADGVKAAVSVLAKTSAEISRVLAEQCIKLGGYLYYAGGQLGAFIKSGIVYAGEGLAAAKGALSELFGSISRFLGFAKA